MRHRLAAGVLGAGLLMAVAAPPAQSAARVEEHHYTALPIVLCGEAYGSLIDGSGACYDLQAGDTSVSVVIDDDHSDNVTGRLTFYRPIEDELDYPFTRLETITTVEFCTASSDISIPADATVATLRVATTQQEAVENAYPALHAAAGGPEGVPGPDPSPCGLGTGATAGTILAEFS